MSQTHHQFFSEVRRPSADKPSSRAGNIKTWMVLDTLSFNHLPKFYLCYDDLQLPEALDHYAITYHLEIGARLTERYRKLQAFENWARSVFLRIVPKEVEIWQVDLGRDEDHVKKTFYEDFYGIELVQFTRNLPSIDHPRREEKDRLQLESGREVEMNGRTGVRKPQLGSKAKLEIGPMQGGRNARAKIQVLKGITNEWNAEEDGWENEQTGRYFVTMPDYCFIGDNLKQEQRKLCDAFGECSKATFNTAMQLVEEGEYINFKCTLNDLPGHGFQQWRAYLYQLRPMRPYDRPNDNEKRKRHPLTEEETKYERRAKRRWSAYQRGNLAQALEVIPEDLIDRKG